MKIKTNINSNPRANEGLRGRCSEYWKVTAQSVLAAILVAITGVMFVGCKTSHASSDSVASAGSPNYSTNLLAEGDVVSITFQYSTNYNTIQKIGLDKMINLQGVGQVKAAGMSALELQNQLIAFYATLVKDDPIIVRIVSTEACVYVMGAVNHPGRIPLERPMTVVEAIMEAGGYDSDRAKLSQVWVLRVEDGRQRAFQLNLNRVINGEDDKVFFLKPFDIVRVPTKTFNY